MPKHLRYHLLLLISSFFWGISTIIMKIGITYQNEFVILSIRFLVATIILFIYIWLNKIPSKISKVDFRFSIYTGLIGFSGYYILETLAITKIEASVISLFHGSVPIIVILFETLLKYRKPSYKLYIMLILGATGLYLIISNNVILSFDFLGYLYILLAVIFWVFYLFINKRRKSHPIVIITYQMLFATIGFFIASIFFTNLNDWFISTEGLIAIFTLALFSTSIANVCFYIGNINLGPGIASIYDNLVFAVGFIMAAIVLNEVLTIRHFTSFLLIVLSIFISFTFKDRSH